MLITYREGAFLAISKFEERDALKEANFSFHEGLSACPAGPATCLACRVKFNRGWWTKRAEIASRLAQFTDDRAKGALAVHLKAIESSRALDADIEIPCNNGLAYFGYQKAGVSYMATRDATLLGDDMGVGKTIQILALINYLKNISSVLVICPASLRVNWYREAQKWLVHDERKWRYHIVDNDEAVPEHSNFIIANYNRIYVGYEKCKGPCQGDRANSRSITCETCKGTGNGEQEPDLCGECKGKKVVPCPACKGKAKLPAHNIKIVESLFSRDYDLLAADESHFIKSPKAARTRAIIGYPAKKIPGLIEKAKRKIFMTGTPLPNRPVEMWPILSVCAPKEFGDFRQFAKRYCNAHAEWLTEKKQVWKTDGASNLEELQNRLRSTVLIRRLKKDVLKDLPAKIRQIIPLIPSEAAKKLIAEEVDIWNKRFGDDMALISESLSESGDADSQEYQNAVEKLKYIQRVAFMEMGKIRHDVAVAKIPSVIEHLDSMFREGVSKVVCFAHHHDVIQQVAEAFGDKAVMLYGATKGGTDANSERQQAIDRFQTDKKVKLFVGGLLAAGTGITLTAASNVVFAELDWTPSNITQAEDRCHRLGQKNSVLVQHLVLNGSLDARMAQLLISKQEIADRALDRTTMVTPAIKSILEIQPEVPVEPVSRWKKILLKEALIIIAKRRDPKVEGSHGFSEFDASIGQKLATTEQEYSDKQAHLVLKLIKKYHRQLPVEVQKRLEIYEEPSPAQKRKLQREAAMQQKMSILDMIEFDAQSIAGLSLPAF